MDCLDGSEVANNLEGSNYEAEILGEHQPGGSHFQFSELEEEGLEGRYVLHIDDCKEPGQADRQVEIPVQSDSFCELALQLLIQLLHPLNVSREFLIFLGNLIFFFVCKCISFVFCNEHSNFFFYMNILYSIFKWSNVF